jgi:hypothetical protein
LVFTFRAFAEVTKIFVHPDVKELLNLQNVKGQVKSYQVKKFLDLVERYSLELEE